MKLSCPFFARERYGRRGGEDGERDSASKRGSRLSGIRGAHGARPPCCAHAKGDPPGVFDPHAGDGVPKDHHHRNCPRGGYRPQDVLSALPVGRGSGERDRAGRGGPDRAHMPGLPREQRRRRERGRPVQTAFDGAGARPEEHEAHRLAHSLRARFEEAGIVAYGIAYRTGHAWPEEVGAVSRFLCRVFQCGARGSDPPLDLRRVGDSPRGYRPGDALARP